MDDRLKKIIEQKYGIQVSKVVDAPRQFVAETFIISGDDQRKYFCKVVNKPLFIPHLIESLPVLAELLRCGFDRINYPIMTADKELSIMVEDKLVVLFNYIDASQSFDYDLYSFGKLIANLHKMATQVNVPVARENFKYRHEGLFLNKLNSYLTSNPSDQVLKSLNLILNKYSDELIHDYEKFEKLSDKLKSSNVLMVLTHGDPCGNTLMKTPTDLYLIDGDDMLMAPAERDTWFLEDKPEFIRGYQDIFPNYVNDKKLCHYFTYKRYFEDLMEYFAEIDNDKSREYRQKNLDGLVNDCFEGWLRPAIRRFDSVSN